MSKTMKQISKEAEAKIWIQFYCAAVSNSDIPRTRAAELADQMLVEYRERYVPN